MKKVFAILLFAPSVSFSQNVGIGTNNPQQKLHVAGGIRVDELAGSNGVLKYNGNGDLIALPASGNPNEALLGNGNWGSVNGTVAPGTVVASLVDNDAALTNKGFSLYGYIPGFTRFQSLSSFTAPANTWEPTYLEGIPAKTPPPSFDGNNLFVWLDSVMYVFTNNNFYAYNPASDVWRFVLANPTSYKASAGARLIWTGTEIIVWGGNYSVATENGFRYNPVTDTWTAIPITDQPTARTGFAMEFINNRVVAWGGLSSGGIRLGDGAMFNLATNTWTPINATGAPSARNNFTSVNAETQNKMIIWGGRIAAVANGVANDGAAFDPVTNTWAAITTTGAPSAREFHNSVWSGTEMIVFGGHTESITGTPLNSGARYNPVTNTWSATTTTAAPNLKSHAAIWTGSVMLVSGGNDNVFGVPNTPYSFQSYSYNPSGNTWQYIGPTWVHKASHKLLIAGNMILAFGGVTHILNPITNAISNSPFYNNGSRYFLNSQSVNLTRINNVGRLYLYIKN